METHGRLLTLTLMAILIPEFAPAAAPRWWAISETTRDVSLGCRWRRCVATVPVMPRVEDDRVRLQLNFDKGQPYYVELKTETMQTMKVMGQDATQTQVQTFYLQWTPLGRNQRGFGIMRMKIIGVKMKLDIGGVVIDFDSTVNRIAATPLTDYIAKMVDAEFKFTIDPRDGKVQKIDGHDDFIKKVGNTSPQMDPLVKSIISQDALIQMFAPMFTFVPGQPVRPGDTWERTHTLDLGPIGSYRNATQCTYDRQADNRVRLLVKNKLHYDPPVKKDGLPFQIKDAVMASTDGAGEITFDLAKGRLVESTLRQTLTGTLTIEVGGVITPVVLNQWQTVRIWVTERNPLAGRD